MYFEKRPIAHPSTSFMLRNILTITFIWLPQVLQSKNVYQCSQTGTDCETSHGIILGSSKLKISNDGRSDCMNILRADHPSNKI